MKIQIFRTALPKKNIVTRQPICVKIMAIWPYKRKNEHFLKEPPAGGIITLRNQQKCEVPPEVGNTAPISRQHI
jgi:hypothetical protein